MTVRYRDDCDKMTKYTAVFSFPSNARIPHTHLEGNQPGTFLVNLEAFFVLFRPSLVWPEQLRKELNGCAFIGTFIRKVEGKILRGFLFVCFVGERMANRISFCTSEQDVQSIYRSKN